MREKKISRASTPSRLYTDDENFLKRSVKERGLMDTRFKDNSAAVRHYVHLGIITEKRTATANTLDDRIIKSTQKEVVTDSLLPLKNSIDGLINAIENIGNKQEEHFSESRIQIDKLLRSVESLNELCTANFKDILEQLMMTGRVSDAALRNSIILRSILYVFLIGIKTGRIEPDERTPWHKLVSFADEKAKELSGHEFNAILDGKYETKTVRALAEEMFAEIKKLQGDLPVKVNTE